MAHFSHKSDIKKQRLPIEQYEINFADIAPPLSATEALIESERCLYCYDAPCLEACPTGINIPEFIRQIHSGNSIGAAHTIFSSNIMGGTCARVCPVDTLCEGECVREKAEGKPVKIGLLQRYATDHFFNEQPLAYPFTRAKSTGIKVAIIGAGPAGLACAHTLAQYGHEITIFEAKDYAGGLNADGLAKYKISNEFVASEIDFILKIGGIRLELNKKLGRDFTLVELQQKFAAVFLACGLQEVNQLNIPGENLKGVYDAVDYIAQLRRTQDVAHLSVGKRVVVIGGGNTAVDIASQIKRLGASEVMMIYRRHKEQLKATPHEQEIVQNDGVTIRCCAVPLRIIDQAGYVSAVECAETRVEKDKLIITDERFVIPADMVFKAIGQTLVTEHVSSLQLKNNRVAVDANGATSLPGVFAGGDCVAGGEDLTVTAVEDGKITAQTIQRYLLTQAQKE